MKEFVLSLSLQSVLLSKKILNRFHQKVNLPHVRPTDKLFSKNEVTTKGTWVGCVFAQKAYVCFITSGALIKEIFMKSSLIFLIGTWTTANPKPIPPRQIIVQNPVFNVSILSFLRRTLFLMFLTSLFLCRALWCDQTKGPSDLVPQSDVLKLLPLSQVGCFVICFGVGLLIICYHSFKLVFSSRLANPLFVVEFSQTYRAVVHGVVWFIWNISAGQN